MFFAKITSDEKRWARINMIAQILFGVIFVVMGLIIIVKFGLGIGSQPTSLVNNTKSYWYDANANALLSIENGEFNFTDIDDNVYIDGSVKEKILVSSDSEIEYSIEDECCIISYQGVDYKLLYVDENSDEIISKFEPITMIATDGK